MALPAHVVLEPLESRRFLSAGQLDPFFGQFGLVDQPANTIVRGATAVEIRNIHVQPDNRIVVVAQVTRHLRSGDTLSTVISRYLPNGSPDLSFARDGTSTVRGIVRNDMVAFGDAGEIWIATYAGTIGGV